METTVAPTSPAPDSAPPTISAVLAEPYEEISDDYNGLGLESGVDDPFAGADRAKLMAFADRLLKHLAADEAEVDGITAAAALEVNLVTQRYQAVAQKATKRASWKRFCLEQIAALLFQDATSKSKSISLPYGTIGRRDFKGAPELVDEAAAIERARVTSRDKVKVTWIGSLEELEDRMVTFAVKVDQGSSGPLTLTQIAQEFIDQLIEGGLEGESGFVVKLALKWGELKKEPGVSLYAVERDGHSGGVKMGEPTTKFFAEVTSA